MFQRAVDWMNGLIVGAMGQISLAAAIMQSQNLALREQIMAASTSASMTMTGKATSVYDPKPMTYKAVRVWLSDGRRIWINGTTAAYNG
jgi:capsid protein